MKHALALFLALACACNLPASPASDLSSPSPEIRSAAAAILRTSYEPPPEAKWGSLLAALKEGEKMTNVEAILTARGIKPGFGGGSQSFVTEYRLDEHWLLKCSGLNRLEPDERVMSERHLEPSPIWVHVVSPTNFTGVWIEYFMNGQKCFETNMKDGAPCGDCICYSSDGSKVYVEHYAPNSPEIGWTDFYHSGSIKTRGNRDKRKRPIGTWTNYNADGSIMGTRTY